jgi:hypothetical protein
MGCEEKYQSTSLDRVERTKRLGFPMCKDTQVRHAPLSIGILSRRISRFSSNIKHHQKAAPRGDGAMVTTAHARLKQGIVEQTKQNHSPPIEGARRLAVIPSPRTSDACRPQTAYPLVRQLCQSLLYVAVIHFCSLASYPLALRQFSLYIELVDPNSSESTLSSLHRTTLRATVDYGRPCPPSQLIIQPNARPRPSATPMGTIGNPSLLIVT